MLSWVGLRGRLDAWACSDSLAGTQARLRGGWLHALALFLWYCVSRLGELLWVYGSVLWIVCQRKYCASSTIAEGRKLTPRSFFASLQSSTSSWNLVSASLAY